MLINYLKTAYRNSIQKKTISIINLSGLLLGTITFLFIIQFLYYELSYDRFHKDHKDIYRIYSEASIGDLHSAICISVAGMGPTIKSQLPEVDDFTRIYKSAQKSYIIFDENRFIENDIYWVDTSFFKIFSFHVFNDENISVLKDPNTALISESAALKYFGEKNPINQTIRVFNSEVGEAYYTIGGIFKDIPENSHINCQIALSYKTMSNRYRDWFDTGWEWFTFQTYLKLKKGTNPHQVEEKITQMDKKYRSAIISSLGTTYRRDYFLQPITRIHLFSKGIDYQLKEGGNFKSVLFLGIISIFILIITWLNYLNLSTVRGMERAKEIGMRKILGEFRSKLIRNSLFGTVLLNLLVGVAAILFVMIFQSLFNSFAERPLSFKLINEWWVWLSIIGLFVLGAILSGLYPSIILSSFKPISVLKGKFSKSTQNIMFKRILIIIQFAIAIFFISGTIIVYKQLTFLQNKDVGMDINKCLVINGPAIVNEAYTSKFETFKKELLKNSNVLDVSSTNYIPGNEVRSGTILKPNNLNVEGSVAKEIIVDYNYLDELGFKLLAGRNFSNSFSSDDSAIIVNKKAAEILNVFPLEKLINSIVVYNNRKRKLIGIIDNYHQTSPKDDYVATVFSLNKNVRDYFVVKLKSMDNLKETTVFVQNIWNKFFKENPFSYYLLNDYYQAQYKNEFKFGEIFRIFSIISLFITCLGILGLVSYNMIERTKEIGIRKTLGASFSNIYILLSKEYIILVLLSIVITTPFIFYYMPLWLNNFAFRIKLNVLIIVEAVLITLFITLIVSSYYIIKTALTNPTKSLANE